MRIHVWVADQHDRESQRSLINTMLSDPRLHGADISLQPPPQASDTMGPGFEVIQLVVDSGFQIATLALAFVTWRRDCDRAAELVVRLDDTTRTLSGQELLDVPAAVRALSGQPDPSRSCCVLVGVSRYPHLGDLPAVEQNCVDLASALVDPGIWGVPWENCRMVLNPQTPRDLLTPVGEAATAAEDTLLVYFSGHGLCDSDGRELHLCLGGAKQARAEAAATVPWRDLRTILRASRAKHRVVILDCCYSGLAIDERDPSASLLEAAKADGIYTLTAASKHSLALAPRSARHTAFTGEIIRALREPRTRAEFTTLDDLYRTVRTALIPHQPEPQREGPLHVGSLPYFRVPRSGDPVEAAPASGREDPPMPKRRRLFLWAAPLAVTAVTATVVAVVLWPSGPQGPCSADTRLVGFSDDLDKVQYGGTTVGGLSALTMTSPSEAVSLTDNAPPRLYHLTLGGDPRHVGVKGMTTLVRSDGSHFQDREFDGEGMVLQPHNVLISSETEPSIVRFDRRSGKQNGALDVPPLYRVKSGGGEGPAENFESLTATSNGRLLYAGLEEPLWRDGKVRGQPLLRILRYSGMADQGYTPDGQYGYKADTGLNLVDMVALEDNVLLTLERGYMDGVGNAIRVYRTTLGKKWGIGWDNSLRNVEEQDFATKTLLVNLAACPAGGAQAREAQPNPLLQNVEGMALGPVTSADRRMLYLISDDNLSHLQTTRVYRLDIPLSGTPEKVT
ncbi:hypothetical protein GCM10009850_105110 [Nonomuraea monospora]|uniref:Caspase domain-containing protein n=1 Tax=Nonomuraea monospora TaxID=568818 RepID=A0ABN3CZY0_9ACTN